MTGSHQLCSPEEQPSPQALQHGLMQMGWGTEAFEPVQSVADHQGGQSEFVCAGVSQRALPAPEQTDLFSRWRTTKRASTSRGIEGTDWHAVPGSKTVVTG